MVEKRGGLGCIDWDAAASGKAYGSYYGPGATCRTGE